MNDKRQKWIKRNPLYLYRMKNGISRMDAAADLEVSAQSVYLWENGANFPRVINLLMIGTLMGRRIIEEWERWWKLKPRGGK